VAIRTLVSASPIDGEFYFAGGSLPRRSPAWCVRLKPNLVPVGPPTAPATAPLGDPADIARTIARAQRNPVPVPDARTLGGQVEISGLASRGRDWDALVKQLSVTRGLRLSTRGRVFPRLASEPVDMLGALVRNTRERRTGR